MKLPTLVVIVYVACFVAWVMTLLPSGVYLFTEWRTRRDRLLGVLDNESLKFYYQRFFPSRDIQGRNLETIFSQDFGSLYGRRHYIIPLLLLAIVSGLGLWTTAIRITGWPGGQNMSDGIPMIAVTGFLGGYAWVLLDQFSRYQSRDFTKHNVYNGVYRLLIAIPIGFSFSALASPSLGVPLAFLLGAFPTQTLMKFARRLVLQRMKLGEEETDGPTELAKLQGIGKENAERFQQVDVTTIVQLAWADPVELTIRTNLDFNYIIDCISQALLWVYFTDDTKELYAFSLRGAQEVRYLYKKLKSKKSGLKEQAKEAIEAAAKKLHMSEGSLKHTLEQIAGDPYTKFISDVWATADEESESE